MRGGSPSHLGGPGDLPRKNWKVVVPEKRFKPVFGKSFRFQT